MEESMHVGEQETSLQDQSYHTIRRKIVYLDYKPGEKLGVKQLCDDLDMGRTPVREALVRLAQEGLVRTVPQSGTYVSPINLTFAESACYIPRTPGKTGDCGVLRPCHLGRHRAARPSHRAAGKGHGRRGSHRILFKRQPHAPHDL